MLICPVCGAEVSLLGTVGGVSTFYCRECPMQFSRILNETQRSHMEAGACAECGHLALTN